MSDLTAWVNNWITVLNYNELNIYAQFCKWEILIHPLIELIFKNYVECFGNIKKSGFLLAFILKNTRPNRGKFSFRFNQIDFPQFSTIDWINYGREKPKGTQKLDGYPFDYHRKSLRIYSLSNCKLFNSLKCRTGGIHVNLFN